MKKIKNLKYNNKYNKKKNTKNAKKIFIPTTPIKKQNGQDKKSKTNKKKIYPKSISSERLPMSQRVTKNAEDKNKVYPNNLEIYK